MDLFFSNLRNWMYRILAIAEAAVSTFVFILFLVYARSQLAHSMPYLLVTIFFLVIVLSNILAKLTIIYIKTYEHAQ